MFERPRSGERAVLVHVHAPGRPAPAERAELAELARSAGATVTAVLDAPRREPDPRFHVGEGKLEEIEATVRAEDAELVIFDRALTPAQERNLEARLRCRVLDRIGLILDIFAQRASTFEGKLQVELAQLRHLSTRLVRGWSHLERQKGGIGLRGPGEKQLETDRRLVARRIRRIEARLEATRRRRELSRRARRRAELPLVSLVGYTNAGKSTLFNALTGAAVGAEARLFATLDPTLRRIALPGGTSAVVADTVGFIRNLPHDLVAAFRATLEETLNASLLLHVVDASDPERDAKIEQVDAVLAEIGADHLPQLRVLNKVDRAGGTAGGPARAGRVDRDDLGRPARVWISARTGAGLEALREALAERLAGAAVRRRAVLPPAAGRLRARLFSLGAVVGERTGEAGEAELDLLLPEPLLDRLCAEEGLGRHLRGEAEGRGAGGPAAPDRPASIASQGTST